MLDLNEDCLLLILSLLENNNKWFLTNKKIYYLSKKKNHGITDIFDNFTISMFLYKMSKSLKMYLNNMDIKVIKLMKNKNYLTKNYNNCIMKILKKFIKGEIIDPF